MSDASLLPLAQQQFFDDTGAPLAAGTVLFTVPPVGNNTLKDTWQDSTQTVLNTNPVVLDAAGRATIYGYGQYVMTVKDSLGNQIFQGLTSDAFLDQNGSQLAFLWCGTAIAPNPNAYTVSPDPAIQGPTLSPGTPLAFIVDSGSNTDASTLEIANITGAIALKKVGLQGLEDLKGGELIGGEVNLGIYDGTQIVLVNCPLNTQFTNFLGTGAGTADAQQVIAPGIGGVATGQMFGYIVGPDLMNDGATTLAFNVSPTVDVKKPSPIGPVALSGGELQPGCLALFVFDGTDAILLNPSITPNFVNASTTQTADETTCGTVYRADGADLTIDLPLTTDVWKGYILYGIADENTITITPDPTEVINGGSAGASVTFDVGSTFSLITDGAGNWYVLSESGTGGVLSAGMQLRGWILWSGSGVTASSNATMTHVSTGKYSVVMSGGFTFAHGGAQMTGTKSGGSTGYYGAANANISGLNPTFTLNTFSGSAASDADGLGFLFIFGV